MNNVPMPTRARLQTLEAVRSNTGGGFDIDAWHVMDQRDNALIAEELLNGSGSAKFVYAFSVSGTQVAGISVVGARHLAAHYGGIKHRMVASVQKIKALHTFTSYPQPGMPMAVECKVVPELEDQDDYYSAIIEMTDIKTGNVIMVEKREGRYETRKSGGAFERPHYPLIAQAKAYRNGVLTLIPQDVQLKFKLQMLELDKSEIITGSVLDEKRAGVLRFAAKHSLPVDRRAIEALTMAQIGGLADAARGEGGPDVLAFRKAADSLGVIMRAPEPVLITPPQQPAQAAAPLPATAPPARPAPAAQPAPQPAQSARAAGFEAYLIDEVGEVVSDIITDPLAFANMLMHAHSSVSADAVAQLLDNNADAMRAAMLSPAARHVLDSITSPEAPEDAAGADEADIDPAAVMPMTQGARGADVAGWVKAAVAQMDKLADPMDLKRWVDANGATYAAFPAPRRMEVSRAVAARASTLGVPPPAVQHAPAADEPNGDLLKGEPAKPATDTDAAWIAAVTRRIERMGSVAELRALDAEAAEHAAQVKERKPLLVEQLHSAFRARFVALNNG